MPYFSKLTLNNTTYDVKDAEARDDIADVKRQFVNVKSYGAKGDGVTDDSVAIQTAIAALPNENGVLFFPHGIYIHGDGTTTGENYTSDGTAKGYIIDENHPATIGRDIRLIFNGLKNITVIGDGAEIRSNDNNGEVLHNAIFWFQFCDGITIKGITINGRREERGLHLTDSGTDGANMRYNIYVGGCSDVLIENVKSINSAMDGVYFGAALENGQYIKSQNCNAVNCDFSNAHRNCVSVANVDTALIDNCILNDAGTSGATWDGTAPKFGVDVEADAGETLPSTNIKILNCTALNDAGVASIGVVFGSQDVEVRGCYVNNNIVSSGEDRNSKNIRIIGNTLKNCYIRTRVSGEVSNNVISRDGSSVSNNTKYNHIVADTETEKPLTIKQNRLYFDSATIPSGYDVSVGVSINNSNCIFNNNILVNPVWKYSGTPLTFNNFKEVVGNIFALENNPEGYRTDFPGPYELTIANLTSTGIFKDNHFYGYAFSGGTRGRSQYNSSVDTAVTKTIGFIGSFNQTTKKLLKILKRGNGVNYKIHVYMNDMVKDISFYSLSNSITVESTGNTHIKVLKDTSNNIYLLYDYDGLSTIFIVIELIRTRYDYGDIGINSISEIVEWDTETDISTLTDMETTTQMKGRVVYQTITRTSNSVGTVNLPFTQSSCAGLTAVCTDTSRLCVPFYNVGNGSYAVKVYDLNMQPVANTEITFLISTVMKK